MNWTVDRVQDLRAYLARHWSYTQIAVEMRVSRNAIAGKINRLMTPEEKAALGISAASAREANGHRNNHNNPTRRIAKLTGRDPGLPPMQPAPAEGRLTILELTAKTCRWPYGDHPPLLYCGEAVDVSGPYCPAHFAIAFQRLSK